MTNTDFRIPKQLKVGELEKKFRQFKKLDTKEVKAIKISVLSNVSTQFIIKALTLSMWDRGYLTEVYESPYNQWEMELVNPHASFLENDPDYVVLTLSSLMLMHHPFAKNDPEKFVEHLSGLISQAQGATKAKFLLTLPEPTQDEWDQTSWAYSWRKELRKCIRQTLGKNQDIQLLDLDPLIHQIGLQSWTSSKFFISAKLPNHPDYAFNYGQYLAHFIVASIKQPTRLVVLDLDNTLWGGIVGEDGVTQLNLSYEEKGYSFLQLQRYLLDLHEKGVLLALCSKNTEDVALEVFEKRQEMILKKEHFADIQINWGPKSKNIQQILSNLNLTATGCVFLDDSHFEREEVKSALPEVFVPELPEDHGQWMNYLLSSGIFTTSKVSADDLKRQESYRVERKRREEQQNFSNLSDFLGSLQLELTPYKVNKENLERVSALVGKTNQFNLTTKRHTRAQIESFMDNPNHYLYAYQLKDKFSDYGIIGVIFALKRDEKSFDIDSWLLSCRAMGRTTEFAMFEHLYKEMREKGVQFLNGAYLPTSKNMPVKDLYSSLGFNIVEECNNETRYVRDLSTAFELNKHVEIKE